MRDPENSNHLDLPLFENFIKKERRILGKISEACIENGGGN